MSRRRQKAHPCPTPSKKRYPSIDEARESYRRDQVNPVMREFRLADRAYPCQCGVWHRTRRHDAHFGSVPLD